MEALEVDGAGSSDPAPSRPSTRRWARIPRWIRWTALVVAVVVVGVGIDATSTYRRLERTDIDARPVDDGTDTWLLIGSDNRAAAANLPDRDAFGTTEDVPGARADVMVLVQPAHDGQPARMVSVPRDLTVYRTGVGADRLTLTFIDGVASTVRAICGTLGVAVDHVAIVEFDTLRDLVDEVGGIEVTVDVPTRDRNTGLDLPAGTTTLDGAETIAWVRSRHREELIDGRWVADDRGDLGRQENQREVLGELAGKVSDASRNPWRARTIAQTIAGGVTVDDHADPLDLVRLGRTLASQPESASIPHRYAGGIIPTANLDPEAQGLLDGLRAGTPEGTGCPRARPQPG